MNKLVQRTLAATLTPAHVILFVRDLATYEYRPQPDPHGPPPDRHHLWRESGLVRYLRDRASLLYLEEGRPLPLDVVSDRARLAVLGAPVIVAPEGPESAERLSG